MENDYYFVESTLQARQISYQHRNYNTNNIFYGHQQCHCYLSVCHLIRTMIILINFDSLDINCMHHTHYQVYANWEFKINTMDYDRTICIAHHMDNFITFNTSILLDKYN